MLKSLLYIFAVLGLLISPVHAQAAQKHCADMAETMPGTSVKAMHDDGGMACCDHTMKTSSKQDKGCINHCVAMAGVTVALTDEAPFSRPILADKAVTFTDSQVMFDAQEPGLFYPPPIANT